MRSNANVAYYQEAAETPLVDTTGMGARNRLIAQRLESAMRIAMQDEAYIDAIKVATVLAAFLASEGRHSCAELVLLQRNACISALRGETHLLKLS